MEEILKRLQALQISAMHKNINFDILMSHDGTTKVEAHLSYFSAVMSVQEQYVMNVKFTERTSNDETERRFNNIERFIHEIV